MSRRVLSLVLLPVGLALATAQAVSQEDEDPPVGNFGLSRIDTKTGEAAAIHDFFLSSDCALCHPRQWEEMNGSMHSVAHEDPFYRRFAEMARREAGEEVYTYCSGCHSPAGVVTGLIPHVPEEELPAEAKAGVTCDVCHQVSGLSGMDGPWGEPANASLILDPGSRVKVGLYDEIERNPAHQGVRGEHLASSEFCASCHTVIHPLNGLRIEHTYDEWKASPYAEAGIRCQDCHMRSVEDARLVAETMRPVEVRGTLARKGEERAIAPHFFVGGNVEAGHLANGPDHARMAAERLRSAATLALATPPTAVPGEEVALTVTVNNVGAGHNLPTSLTELRQMWVHVVVRNGNGELLFESGGLDDHGELLPGAFRFGAEVVDAAGEVTYKPWEAAAFSWKRLIPPKGSDSESFAFELPAGVSGRLELEARLLYRIAPPHVVDEVMGEEAFEPQVVVMARASASVEVEDGTR